MVKVQKPLPKTLNKLGNGETTIKKKSIEKSKPKIKPTPTAAVVAKSKRNNDAASKKKLLLEATVKEASITPVKKLEKKAKQPKDEVKPVPEVNNAKKAPKAAKNVTKIKGPLILAPPTIATPSLVKKPTELKDTKKTKKQQKLDPTKTGQEQKKPLNKQQRKNAARREYQKQKRAKPTKAGKGSPKEKVPRAVTFEPQPFEEQKFNDIVNIKNISKIAKALHTQVGEEVKKQKTSIFSDYRYFLNVASYKIASCPHRMVKLGLKHSLVGEGDDVALIVTDLQRGAKVDYEPTKQHYEDLLREAGIDNLSVVPFNQLRNEINTFESKRKFCNTYDYFLCDGRIVGQAHAHLGKFTQKPRAVLHAVSLHECKDIKKEITRGLHRTAYRQQMKGDLISIPIGNHNFTSAQIAENALQVTEQLKKLHPGGLGNIRSMHLKIDIKGTSSLPLYINMGMPPTGAPYVVGPREQRMLKLKKEANEALAQFTLTKDAKLIKLNEEQVERKRQIRETRNKIIIADDDNEPQDDDGEDSAVPAKKARKEEKVIEKDLKTKNAGADEDDEEEEDEDGEEDDDENVEEEDDNEDSDDDEDDDDDDGDDDDEDDDEAAADSDDNDSDDDDDENNDNDDDEEDDDDEDDE